MLNGSQTTTFLQIFYEFLLYSQVILESMRVADDTLEGISECEWVKVRERYGNWHNSWLLQQTGTLPLLPSKLQATAWLVGDRDFTQQWEG